MEKQKFNIGDKVKLVDYDTYCEVNRMNPNNEKFKAHYDYVKKKEPLEIFWVWAPGSMRYTIPDNENDLRNGQPTEKYYYNIHTPRSKMYLFGGDELEPYEEDVNEDTETE